MEPTTDTAPAPPKKQSPAMRIFLIICGVVVMVSGIAKVWQAVSPQRKEPSPEFKQLLVQSDQAVEEAKRYAGEAAPLFQSLLNEVDTLGLDAFRAQRKEASTKTSDLLQNSVEQFRIAEKKLEESKELNKNEKMTPFLASKSRSYGLWAQTVAINQEMVQLVLDPSIPTVDVLLPKITAASARYKEMEKSAQAVSSEADQLGKQIQSEAKK